MLCVPVVFALGFSTASDADELKAETKFRDTVVGFNLKESYSDVSLAVSGPSHFHASVHTRGTAPAIDLRDFGRLEDGLYNYQLNAATNTMVRTNSKLDNGRGERERAEVRRGVATSGVFWIKNGAIVQHDRNAREDMKRPQ
jgi:hypothetical protein